MGKKSASAAPAVDPSVGIAMQKQADIAERQQEWFETEMMPWLKDQTNIANAAAQQDREFNQANTQWWQNFAQTQVDRQNARADEYYNRWKQTYLPIEDALVAEANKYSTSAEAERQAQAAIGDYASAFAQQRQAQRMQMQAYGINPTAGAYQAQNNALNLNQYALQAAAANQARQAAVELGWQKKTQLAALGQQYIGNSMNQTQTANDTAGTAGGLSGQYSQLASNASQNQLANVSNLANVGLNSYQSLSNAWGQYGNLGMQLSNYNQNAWAQQLQYKSAQQQGMGSIAGGAITAVGAAAVAI